MTTKTIMQQVKDVTATADYNRNVHNALSPDDDETIRTMVNDIELRVKELDDAKSVLTACLQKGQPRYT